MRICKMCEIEKDITEYYLNKEGKLKSLTCIECSKNKFKEYYQNNREKKLKYQSEYIKKNREKIKLSVKKHREENKEIISKRRKAKYQRNKEEIKKKSREYYNDNREKINDKRRGSKKSLEYYHKNKESILPKTYEYRSNRLKEDNLYRLIHTIRVLIRGSLKRKFTTKSKKTIEILGCSFDEFKSYLESKFDEKMNWENQGTYWHMDHIIPISSAQTEEDVYRLNHYTNFQPLYWLDNLKKSNKIEK
jgi:hypothetical protein